MTQAHSFFFLIFFQIQNILLLYVWIRLKTRSNQKSIDGNQSRCGLEKQSRLLAVFSTIFQRMANFAPSTRTLTRFSQKWNRLGQSDSAVVPVSEAIPAPLGSFSVKICLTSISAPLACIDFIKKNLISSSWNFIIFPALFSSRSESRQSLLYRVRCLLERDRIGSETERDKVYGLIGRRLIFCLFGRWKTGWGTGMAFFTYESTSSVCSGVFSAESRLEVWSVSLLHAPFWKWVIIIWRRMLISGWWVWFVSDIFFPFPCVSQVGLARARVCTHRKSGACAARALTADWVSGRKLSAPLTSLTLGIAGRRDGRVPINIWVSPSFVIVFVQCARTGSTCRSPDPRTNPGRMDGPIHPFLGLDFKEEPSIDQLWII